MAKKKRFGIAIDSSLADRLDSIARSLNIDRSKLVEKAITAFVDEHSHSFEDHRCCGVLIVEARECSVIDKVVENHRDIIVSYSHNHIEKRCVCTMIILGDSDKVKGLHKELMLVSDKARYIPIAH